MVLVIMPHLKVLCNQILTDLEPRGIRYALN
jgi:hypothetical protein